MAAWSRLPVSAQPHARIRSGPSEACHCKILSGVRLPMQVRHGQRSRRSEQTRFGICEPVGLHGPLNRRSARKPVAERKCEL